MLLKVNLSDNNFSVMFRQSNCFLGFNQYCGELKCFTDEHRCNLTKEVFEPMTSQYEVGSFNH